MHLFTVKARKSLIHRTLPSFLGMMKVGASHSLGPVRARTPISARRSSSWWSRVWQKFQGNFRAIKLWKLSFGNQLAMEERLEWSQNLMQRRALCIGQVCLFLHYLWRRNDFVKWFLDLSCVCKKRRECFIDGSIKIRFDEEAMCFVGNAFMRRVIEIGKWFPRHDGIMPFHGADW